MSLKKSSYYVPVVIEQTAQGERSYDIYSRLLKDRIIFLGSEIDDFAANSIIAQFLFLQSEDAKKDIDFYINSPGGVVSAGLAIYDTMQMLSCDVRTYCIGQAASMASVLLAAGTKGKRFALPNSRVLVHQPRGGAQGTAADLEIEINEMRLCKEKLYNILSKHIGKPAEQIIKDSDRDFWLSADEAQKYGVVDKVIVPTKG